MRQILTPIMHIVLLLSLVLVQTPHTANAAANVKAGPPPLVTVVIVTEQNVTPSTEYVGHVEAIQTVDLHARVSGLLEEIHFKEGSNVQAGKLLYLIEPAPYQMKLAVNQARVAKTQAAVNSTSQHLTRIQTVRTGGIPSTDIESAEAAALQAQADLQEAQAVQKLSSIDLGYTRITAPISGRIGATAVSKGNLVGPTSEALARIVQLDPIRVLFSISENDLASVKAAQLDAASKKKTGIMQPRLLQADGEFFEQTGQIDFVDNQVDPTTGTIAVRALFANPDGLLLPGQYVRLVASERRTKKLPVIPQSAVLEDRDGRYLLLVDARNQVVQRRITTGPIVGGLWAVEAGINVGEQVIVEGLQKVRPGQTVKITTANAAAAPLGN
ncbi:efflux RND transporter periplasmic adaptor subunit [Geopsychrobacter electrodiphilus]|uniref:efflux RND transporter periplasmic adaptor subunit n=1 Tax=Geopsychrobacter electrodiphilus TaxID=225196 RepID=UPI0003A2BC98|nr:efflux RND transporter periplasmic adaptor subunit [Geopsychrobacter electrodiphilus]